MRNVKSSITEPAPDITALLLAWRTGDTGALDRLLPVVQAELHQIAQRCLRAEQAGHTLQATALVNEAYIRLVDARRVQWQDRAHFLAMSARLMRRVLVDHARARRREKRGSDPQKVTLAEAVDGSDERPQDLIALDDALEALARFDERKSRVVELRYFGGLSVAETAQALDLSPQTVMRDWKFAKAWLLAELRGSTDER